MVQNRVVASATACFTFFEIHNVPRIQYLWIEYMGKSKKDIFGWLTFISWYHIVRILVTHDD